MVDKPVRHLNIPAFPGWKVAQVLGFIRNCVLLSWARLEISWSFTLHHWKRHCMLSKLLVTATTFSPSKASVRMCVEAFLSRVPDVQRNLPRIPSGQKALLTPCSPLYYITFFLLPFFTKLSCLTKGGIRAECSAGLSELTSPSAWSLPLLPQRTSYFFRVVLGILSWFCVRSNQNKTNHWGLFHSQL